jgi:hypothetical protein
VAALSSSTKLLEVVILAAVVILLATILVIYRRNGRPAKASHAAATPTAASYYSDIGTLSAPGTGGGGQFGAAQSDPFAGFGGGMNQGFSAPAAPPAPSAPAMPAPGTPAGWMPDPGGSPDTLRYWDGMSWTQHVAKRN